MNVNDAVQLNECDWCLEEERKTETTINHIRNIIGTFRADADPTCNFLQGYLVGLKMMYRILEERHVCVKPAKPPWTDNT